MKRRKEKRCAAFPSPLGGFARILPLVRQEIGLAQGLLANHLYNDHPEE